MTIGPAPPTTLTRRQAEVIGHVAMGETLEEVGKALYISRNTVRTHLKDVLERLGARNRVHAVAIAFEKGILPLWRWGA